MLYSPSAGYRYHLW